MMIIDGEKVEEPFGFVGTFEDMQLLGTLAA